MQVSSTRQQSRMQKRNIGNHALLLAWSQSYRLYLLKQTMILPSSKAPLAILISIATLSAIYPLIPPYVEWEQPVQDTMIDSVSPVSDNGNYSLPLTPLVYDEPTPPSDTRPEAPTVTDKSPPAWLPETTGSKPENVTSFSKGDNEQSDNNCRVTQQEHEHVQEWQWSIYAIDVHCGEKGKPSDVYFPTGKKHFEILAIGNDERLGDYIIIKHGDIRYIYGHTVTSRKQWDKINTDNDGNVLGQENKSGMWNWYHAHIEQWKCPNNESSISDCQNVSSTGEVNPKSDKLLEQRGWKPTKPTISWDVDLDKLAYAVARHETGNCTAKKWSSLVNNCFGIRECSGGKCHGFKKYATKEESYKAFKDLWMRWYGWEFPTIQHAIKYSWNDRAHIWLSNVTQFYNQ